MALVLGALCSASWDTQSSTPCLVTSQDHSKHACGKWILSRHPTALSARGEGWKLHFVVWYKSLTGCLEANGWRKSMKNRGTAEAIIILMFQEAWMTDYWLTSVSCSRKSSGPSTQSLWCAQTFWPGYSDTSSRAPKGLKGFHCIEFVHFVESKTYKVHTAWA